MKDVETLYLRKHVLYGGLPCAIHSPISRKKQTIHVDDDDDPTWDDPGGQSSHPPC